ncbi:MAG: hypothetical protein LBG49_00925 [Mycoplasmataceae bacterium]|jgi:hypothetical protein|nr:hypothetical protein [Mycoplasmataceae bacterium]
MKENKEYEMTKSSREDWIGVAFQCHIINKGVNVAPKWFTEFVNKQFKPLAEKASRIEVDVSDIKVRLAKVENRLESIIKLNNLRTE